MTVQGREVRIFAEGWSAREGGIFNTDLPTTPNKGLSHAEWPKANDEYAPPQIEEAIY